jgi:alanyl-tRNA synthetase
VDERLAQMDAVASALKCRPSDVSARVEQIQRDLKEADKKLRAALTGGSSNKLGEAVSGAVDLGSYKLVVARLDGVGGKELRGAWDTVRDKLGVACACVLASVGEDGKVALLAGGTDPAVAAGFAAGNVIKQIAPLVGGRGGGRPNMAQAGGRDAAGVDAALAEARSLLGA